MTLANLRVTIETLLIGDNELPAEQEKLIALLEMGYIEIASRVTALKLLTANNSSEVIRGGPSGSYVRMPVLPTEGNDELDIDRELCPALARIIAGYVSRDRAGHHQAEAQKVLVNYETKVRRFLEENADNVDYSVEAETDARVALS